MLALKKNALATVPVLHHPMNDIDLQALTAPKKARVEIIPLIDVIFFLLATFVLFTLSLNKIAAIDVPLPEAGKDIKVFDDTVYIQASSTGAYYWKQGKHSAPELISAAEIAPRLVDYRRNTNNPRVLIRGDDKAKFGSAIGVLDAVRKAGIAQVSVETVVASTGN
jgi:biopolymer transport protein ExbD